MITIYCPFLSQNTGDTERKEDIVEGEEEEEEEEEEREREERREEGERCGYIDVNMALVIRSN